MTPRERDESTRELGAHECLEALAWGLPTLGRLR
jgi:hypothetical protein